MSTTRQLILDTAEVCFAQRGYDATSMSDVGRLADVKPDAMNYHFGTKSALFDAVVRRRVEPMNESRFALLDAAIARHYPDPPPLEELVEAYVRPPVVANDLARHLLFPRVHQDSTALRFMCSIVAA